MIEFWVVDRVVVDLEDVFTKDRKVGEHTYDGWTTTDNFLLELTETRLTTASTAGGSVTTPADKVTYHSCGLPVPIVATEAAGYVFDVWSGDDVTTIASVGNASTTITMNGDYSITANFIKTYTLTYNAGTGGTITGTTPQTVEEGADGTEVTAVADTGYDFVDWSDGPATPARIDTNVTADLTVTANFTQVGEPHDLTVTSDGCCPITVVNLDTATELGTVDPGASDVLFPDIPYDTEVELTAEVSVCCNFVGWVVDGGDPVGVNPITVTMNSDHAAVATCSEEVGLLTLTVDVVGEGDVEVNAVAPGAYPEEYPFDCSTEVGLEAIPATGWTFTGWSDALSGTENPTTITMDDDKVVTATFVHFDPLVYDVDFSGFIEQDEAEAALADYAALLITKWQVVLVLNLYFAAP
jgi:uncharacterized repeat protein (TIGR02543 family)